MLLMLCTWPREMKCLDPDFNTKPALASLKVKRLFGGEPGAQVPSLCPLKARGWRSPVRTKKRLWNWTWRAGGREVPIITQRNQLGREKLIGGKITDVRRRQHLRSAIAKLRWILTIIATIFGTLLLCLLHVFNPRHCAKHWVYWDEQDSVGCALIELTF